jgi:hypothetical protein
LLFIFLDGHAPLVLAMTAEFFISFYSVLLLLFYVSVLFPMNFATFKIPRIFKVEVHGKESAAFLEFLRFKWVGTI